MLSLAELKEENSQLCDNITQEDLDLQLLSRGVSNWILILGNNYIVEIECVCPIYREEQSSEANSEFIITNSPFWGNNFQNFLRCIHPSLFCCGQQINYIPIQFNSIQTLFHICGQMAKLQEILHFIKNIK